MWISSNLIEKNVKIRQEKKWVATDYPLPNLGILIHQPLLQSNASGTPCAKNVAGGAEELPFPMASANWQTLDGMSFWELLLKETMEKQSDGLGVLVMLISGSDLVIMEGIYG